MSSVNHQRFVYLVLAAVLAAVCIPVARAQVLYGTVVGTVLDSSDAVIHGANITLTNTETGQARTTVTNNVGVFTLSDVLGGPYSVEITSPGFQKYAQSGIQVTINTVTRLEVKLRPGQSFETVTVTSDATVLQTDKSDVHVELQTKAVTDLPLPAYRNYQSLINLVPGATPGAFQNSINDTPHRDLTTNVNGTNRNNNDTRVDGALDKMNVINSHTLYVPPAESIETINISTASFDAEQGMAGGVAVTIISKSGTNQLHGSAFLFHTDNALQSRNFFYNGSHAPKAIDNIPGFTLGGPVKKNKLFYFIDWEGLREGKNTGLTSTVPTADQRDGNFSAYNVTLYNPNSGNPDGSGRVPFQGNMIPLSSQSKIMQKLQALIPLPNLPGVTNNYFSSSSAVINRDNYDAKINFARTEKHTIWGKYSRMDAHVECNPSLDAAGGIGLCLGNKAGQADTTVQMATLGHTWVLSPRLLIDGTFGYFRLSQDIVGPFFGQNFGSDTLGIPGTNGNDIRLSGQPIFNITGYSSLGDAGLGIANPGFRRDAGWTNTSNLSWTLGAHMVRFGFQMVRYQQNDWQANTVGSVRGLFTFDGAITALKGGPAPNQYNAWAAVLLGLPQSDAKDLQFYDPQTAREWQFGWYGQDRWQVTRNLTVSLGLRYEFYPIYSRVGQGIERYDPATNKVLIGGRGSVPRDAGIDVSAKHFGPLVGLAYRLGSSTVLRGGYGMTIDPTSTWSASQRDYPVAFGNTFVGPNSFTPYRPIEQGIPALAGPDISTGVIDLPAAANDTTLPAGLLRRGYIESWNLIVERKLPASLTASVGYVGTHTVRPFVTVDINAGSPGLGTAGRPAFATFGRSAATNLLEPQFGAIYHSLQATLNRQFSGGLFVKGSYTFSRAIDFTDDEPGGLTFNTPSQIGRNRALAGYDRTHSFQMSAIYEFPFGPKRRLLNSGIASLLLRDWQANAVFSAVSGSPFTVTASSASLNAPGNTQTADQVKSDVAILGGIGVGNPWFDPTAFKAVTDVRFGTTGRNVLRGPGIGNTDAGLFRNIPLTERLNMQFRAEAFNHTNTPHFDNPNASLASPASFGTITSASRNDQRVFRFALRFAF